MGTFLELTCSLNGDEFIKPCDVSCNAIGGMLDDAFGVVIEIVRRLAFTEPLHELCSPTLQQRKSSSRCEVAGK